MANTSSGSTCISPAYDRRKHDAGIANYLAVNLGEIPDYYRRFIDPVDIVILKTCPMDANGYFNFSAATLWHQAVIERARMVIVEESSGLPYAIGEQTGVHVSEVDYIIQGDDARAAELPNPPPTDVDRSVARLIISEIEDGACLQIGIGGMPNAVCNLLRESPVKDLGIHTEMMTDGIIDLYRDGRITGARKQLNPGKMACTFALGSRHLYDTIDRNAAMAPAAAVQPAAVQAVSASTGEGVPGVAPLGSVIPTQPEAAPPKRSPAHGTPRCAGFAYRLALVNERLRAHVRRAP